MKMNSKIIALVSALMLVAGIGAFASGTTETVPVGQKAAVTTELAQFFADRGADPQYLNVAPSAIPAEQLVKIMAIVNTADDTTVTTDDHDVMNSLVSGALSKAITAVDSPVYIRLGSTVYYAEEGTSDDDAWVTL
jgi:hypothetical protein